jgi:phosphomannomutase
VLRFEHREQLDEPRGWDKTYCLKHIGDKFNEVHFFGDKTHEGGNDYEIFQSEQTIGHRVDSPDNTKDLCRQIFLSD